MDTKGRSIVAEMEWYEANNGSTGRYYIWSDGSRSFAQPNVGEVLSKLLREWREAQREEKEDF